MTQPTQAALMGALVLLFALCFRFHCSPLHLAALALLNVRAALWWLWVDVLPTLWYLTTRIPERKEEVRTWR